MTTLAPPRLRTRTREVAVADLPENLLDLLPVETEPNDVVSWIREGEGLLGWGQAAVHHSQGADRFAQAEQWWTELADRAEVDDPIGLPGTGLVCFGSFAFAAESAAGGVLAVPEVLVGRRAGRAWITTIGDAAEPDLTVPSRPAAVTGVTTIRDGAIPADQWPGVITRAVARIEAGEVGKVVLARDVIVQRDQPFDLAELLSRLARRYCATWTFAVHGLVGATPEMLVRLHEGVVRSRVLAGTVRRGQHPAPEITESHPELSGQHSSDPRLHLISSAKDLDEHAYAVRSVVDALAPHSEALEVPAEPFVLELPDVYHLATDVTGRLRSGATSLRLAAALHPSAAVCGTPAPAAARMIAELEQMDRGRYAGPVGWMDSAGDGDWGIALRCGHLSDDRRSVRMIAGGGIVAASDPDAELAETEMKLAAMRYALDA